MGRTTASTDIFQAIVDLTQQTMQQLAKHLAEPFAMSLPAILQHLQASSKVELVV